MEERSCFVCSFDYKLPSRTPIILECCQKTLCSKCLQNIIDSNKKCPNCREKLHHYYLHEFSLNLNIVESLKFEQDGNVLCEQCSKNSADKATKICFSCGPVCYRCYDSHMRMKIFEKHEISVIPVEKWSIKLDETLKTPLCCEKHNNTFIEFFCKTCQEAVCGDCITDSHLTCEISSIDCECDESRLCLEKELDKMNIEYIAKKSLETMKFQELELENIDREMKTLKSHCLRMLLTNFEVVKKAFQEKAKIMKENHHKKEKKLNRMKQLHANLWDFVREVRLVHNKRGVLQQSPQVRKQIEYLQTEIKEVKDIEQNDYLTWIKDIFFELQLASKNVLEESPEERLWYVNDHYDDLFPRYKYHLNLVQKTVDYEQQIDPYTITSDISKLVKCTITVLGSLTDKYRKLLDPLTFKASERNSQFMGTHVIALLLADTFHAEHKPLCFSQMKHLQRCSWCIIITSNCDSEKHQQLLSTYGASKFSIISPDPDKVWDHITSAMELPLLQFLKEKRKRTGISECIEEDMETIIRRLEKLSSFPTIKSLFKSTEIPDQIKNALERYMYDGVIIRYGFYFNHFRVVVKEENYKEIKDTFPTTRLEGFPEIVVICQGELKEKTVPFCGIHQAQGRHLYRSSVPQALASESTEEKFGTLGCLAKLKKKQTVALTCYHVCNENSAVYIENDDNERMDLGVCLLTPQPPLTIQNDFTIIAVSREVEEYLSERKLLDPNGSPTNAEVCLECSLNLHGEIVHKLGASTRWTQGKVVGAEILQGTRGLLTVRGMNGGVFGKRGDSGSIVFKENFEGRNQTLEVVAMLHSGDFTPQKSKSEEESDQKQSPLVSKSEEESDQKQSPLVLCLVFKDAFEHLTERSIQSIAFFND